MPSFIEFHFHLKMTGKWHFSFLSLHFPNNGKIFNCSLFTSQEVGTIFFSLFTSQTMGTNYSFSFHFPLNRIFFLFSLFSSRNDKTISRPTMCWWTSVEPLGNPVVPRDLPAEATTHRTTTWSAEYTALHGLLRCYSIRIAISETLSIICDISTSTRVAALLSRGCADNVRWLVATN